MLRIPMSIFRYVLFIQMVIIFTLPGCKKEAPISEVPSITFVSISPNPAVRYQDEVMITIEYTDGNGDLGENTPDIKNLFVTDNRNNVTSEFRISQLAPTGVSIIIQGKLNIKLPPQGFVDDNKTTETAVYSIYLKDRVGNLSNTVQTTALVINK